ncbi:hypothetical protein [uncultured Methanobrevibacter sp.]|uniref:hypothetical protein n=1 Tax=uncultured Methanobrevibacter sp. TaxID=253161 RepID=UPI0025F29358|nr:hypothetical protein [uncultured Methanobrevibacter sp.]
MYFLGNVLILNLADFAVIFGVAFLTVTFTDAEETLYLPDPAYVILAWYVFGLVVGTLILICPLSSVV